MEKSLGRFLPNPKLKLREQLREVCRFRHMSHRSEGAYWHWIQDFLRFHRGKLPVASATGVARADARPTGNGWKHPREMGPAEVRDYLSYLAVERKVAAATQRQALNALTKLWAVSCRL